MATFRGFLLVTAFVLCMTSIILEVLVLVHVY